MYFMNRHFNNRAVSQVIAALLLIAIAVAAAILVYVFSIGLLGSLSSSGGQQTKQQLILSAYDWRSVPATLTLHLRNVGSAAINLAGSDYFVNGVKITTPAWSLCTQTNSLTVLPQGACSVDLPVSGFTPPLSSGVAYSVKIVTPDGAVFSYSAIMGQAA